VCEQVKITWIQVQIVGRMEETSQAMSASSTCVLYFPDDPHSILFGFKQILPCHWEIQPSFCFPPANWEHSIAMGNTVNPR
jgi:hypothetical protein